MPNLPTALGIIILCYEQGDRLPQAVDGAMQQSPAETGVGALAGAQCLAETVENLAWLRRKEWEKCGDRSGDEDCFNNHLHSQ